MRQNKSQTIKGGGSMKKLFVLILVGFILSGCSNVKDLKFTESNQSEIMEKIKNSKDLTGEETGLLTIAMMRYSFEKKSFTGKKVGEIIAEQKKIYTEAEMKEKEAKRLADEAAKKEAQIAAELSKYIVVAPFKKEFRKANYMNGIYDDVIVISFVFENKGTKDIKAFQGEAKFKDLFGTELKSNNLMYDNGLKAGEKKKWTGTLKFNQFSDNAKFRDTELGNIKFEWVPKAIIFADNSKLGSTENSN